MVVEDRLLDTDRFHGRRGLGCEDADGVDPRGDRCCRAGDGVLDGDALLRAQTETLHGDEVGVRVGLGSGALGGVAADDDEVEMVSEADALEQERRVLARGVGHRGALEAAGLDEVHEKAKELESSSA